MLKNPFTQIFLCLIAGFLLLGPLGSVLAFVGWLAIYLKNH